MDHRPAEAAFDPYRDPELDAAVQTQGPLPILIAERLVERGRAKIDAGDPALAVPDFQRVIGHQDAAITGGALLGYGDALYRLDQEDQATVAWEAVTRLRENPSTYRAWRNLAGARVRAGELPRAIEAYREADHRAPQEDKSEIAARLGWLAKETGNTGVANRYFARSRGSTGLTLSLVVIAITAAVSIAADGSEELLRLLILDPDAVAAGELYRLVSVTLVHGGFLHLFLNLYALWVVGPIVESIWGRPLFLLFYVLTAIGASTTSFLVTHALAVGASGAIFGLVGVILAGTRAHNPALDRRARGIVPQLGMFVVINLAFGFLAQSATGLNIDNAAHVGGLIAGLWLGFVVPPGKVPNLRAAVQHPRGQPAMRSPLLIAAGVIGYLGVVSAGLAAGGVTL
jgi:membrane associated rhomboid family serine protease